jgi:tRNA A-37 threonylcarbamoyl transferase component Bud32
VPEGEIPFSRYARALLIWIAIDGRAQRRAAARERSQHAGGKQVFSAMKHVGPQVAGDRERLLAALADWEATGGDTLSRVAGSTLAEIEREMAALVAEVRSPPPADEFGEESECRRVIELIERAAPGASRRAPSGRKDPERIGPYRVLARLGEGGMGAVYKAVHEKLKRVIAIKLLPESRMRDEASVARFEREMEAVGGLDHPNIVTAHDAGEADGMHYLVMELVDGIDLSTLVRRIGPLNPADACEIGRQAGLGLEEAHRRGIVHRDIKPSNLMLASAGGDRESAVVKILDFGLARLSPLEIDRSELTSSGQIMGTLKYMAPEQCLGSRDVDVRADIYSWGATLYKLLCGAAPFEDRDSPLAMLAAVGSEEPPRLSARRASVPRAVEAIVRRMMAKDPRDRWNSPGEVVDALAPWARGAELGKLLAEARRATAPAARELAGQESAIAAPVAARPRPRFLRNRPWAYGCAALVVVATAIALIEAFWEAWDSTPDAKHRWGLAASNLHVGSGSESPVEIGDANERSRRTAEWLAAQGAEMGVSADGVGYLTLEAGRPLPAFPFILNTCSLGGNKKVRDEDLARFDNLLDFTTLILNDTEIGDAGLRQLGRLPALSHLYLSQTKVGDGGLAELRRFPKLATLHLFGTSVTDAGLVHLAEHQQLSELQLTHCPVGDEGLAHLAGLKKLRSLQLQNTNVTAAGIAKLRSALPDCRVGSDFAEERIVAEMERLGGAR